MWQFCNLCFQIPVCIRNTLNKRRVKYDYHRNHGKITFIPHWGGEKPLLSGLEDCEDNKRGMLWMGYLLWVASLPKHPQDIHAAHRWMVMARWGERQGVHAKSSDPKPYSNLTLIDKKKLQRTKGGDSTAHQQSDKYLKEATGQLVLWWHPHERNWTLDFWLFIDPVKNIYYKKKLFAKVFKWGFQD